jgi:hypothetical protein
MEKTLQELIVEALEEARILECALDDYDEDHVLYVAQCLSGAPYSFVEKIYSQSKKMHFAY